MSGSRLDKGRWIGLDRASMIELSVHIKADPHRVWSILSDLGSHPEWMTDAETVDFVSEQRTGLGTEMRVPTRVGPLRTNDVMTVVEWEEGRVIGVKHQGAVSGTGRFVIEPSGDGSELRWTEVLRFPWWLGGPVAAWLARPVLRRIWRRNLSRLARLVEFSSP